MYTRFISAAIGAVAAIPVAVWLTDRTLPSDQGQIEIVVVTRGYLVFRQAVARRRTCAVQIIRSFLDGNGRIWSSEVDFYSTNGLPGQDTWGQTVPLPLSLEPGPAVFRLQKTWICNPLQHLWPIEWHGEQKFTVPGRGS